MRYPQRCTLINSVTFTLIIVILRRSRFCIASTVANGQEADLRVLYSPERGDYVYPSSSKLRAAANGLRMLIVPPET